MNNKFDNPQCSRTDAEVQQRFHNEQDPEVTRCDSYNPIGMNKYETYRDVDTSKEIETVTFTTRVERSPKSHPKYSNKRIDISKLVSGFQHQKP